MLQIDLRQFFPSIDHAVLRDLLAAKIQDQDVLWLIDQILAGGAGVLDNDYDMVYFPGDDLFAINRPRGLPIGNLTSQFWANVILDPVDHFILRELRCPGYVRYVDDFLLFSAAKEALWEAKRSVEERLARLRLTMHPGSHPRPVSEGIPFLGFIVWPERRRLKRRNGVRFHRRLRELLHSLETGEVQREDLAASIRGWANHARFGNTTGLRRAVLADVPSEVEELLDSIK